MRPAWPAGSRLRRACSSRWPSPRCPMFAIGALRRLADAEGLTRVELAVSSAREGMRQSTEDLLTAARILGERPALQRLLRGPVPETLAAVPRALLRECGARRLRARARRGLDRHDDERDRVGSRARGGRRAGRAVPDHRRGAEDGVVRRAGRRQRARRHHRHRACATSTSASRRGSPSEPACRSRSSTTRRSSRAKARSRS